MDLNLGSSNGTVNNTDKKKLRGNLFGRICEMRHEASLERCRNLVASLSSVSLVVLAAGNEAGVIGDYL